MDASVLIVGAGPTGLVMALWLNKLGVPFRIVEKRAGPGEASRAMAVQARTLEFYRQLEIAEEVVAGGIEVTRLFSKRPRRAGKLRKCRLGGWGRGSVRTRLC